MTRAARIAATLLVVVAVPAGAQQPTVSVTAAAQITTGDELRLGGQHRFEPDLTIQVSDPGARIGSLYADLNVTRRDDKVAIGRGVLRIEGVKAVGLSWSLDAGHTWAPAAVQDFGFSNLFAPAVTFEGVLIRGRSPRTSLLVAAGRITAQRNIFGTDNRAVGQDLYQASWAYQSNDQLEIHARGVYVRSGAMNMYSAYTDRSADVGGGVRYRPWPSVQVVADAGVTAFTRRGSSGTEYAPSALAGAIWAFPHGSVQVNAQRFPLGYFPVANYPYSDRSGIFVAGELDAGSFARVFAGGEYAKSNLDRPASDAATVIVPPGVFSRFYGGVRARLGNTSTVTLRVEGGGREITPSKYSAGFESDTGVITAEWHARFSMATIFARYERRSNVDPNNSGSSFTQHDGSAQVYLNLKKGPQVFALAYVSSRADRTGGGETLWHAGVGAQMPLGPLYLRAEGTLGRTRDWNTADAVTRQTVSIGLGGRIADRTYLSLDCFVDHSPVAGGLITNPWMTRTMVRLTRSFPVGRARTSGPSGKPLPRGGAAGRVTGTVFTDWNANGVMDPGEEPVNGVTVSLGDAGSVSTGRDGRFEFTNVPVGTWQPSIDLATVPADFDVPEGAAPSVSVARNQSASVSLGLLPLGAVQGTVYQDVDGDGVLSAADTPIDRAVLVLDDGARTEVAREGRFRFDSVRMGTHTVTLLTGSLPDGAQLAGEASTKIELAKDKTPDKLVFLVKIEKRPEIRKVFPPKKKAD